MNTRKGFYAASRWWVFYVSDSIFYYTTSVEGSTWADNISLGSGENGEGASIWFDGTYVFYTRSDDTGSNNFFRMGTPHPNGSISWAAAEQIVFTGAPHSCHYPFISVDSDGYHWIIYNSLDGGLDNGKPKIHKSSTKDGIWTENTALGFPYYPCSRDTEHRGLLLPMTSGKMMAIYKGDPVNGDPIYTKLWTGSIWEGENSTGGTIYAEYFSAVTVGDAIHLVYKDGSSTIKWTQWNGTGWDTTQILASEASYSSSPTIGKDNSGNLYVFWMKNDDPTIYYTKRIEDTWEFSEPYVINPATSKNENQMNCFYEYYDNRFAVLYQTKESSPYDLRITLESHSFNNPPNITQVYPSIGVIRSKNHHDFVQVSIEGITDPDGDDVLITIISITSDEPTASMPGTGGGKHAPDAYGIGTGIAHIRGERSGVGNGRVYVITYIA